MQGPPREEDRALDVIGPVVPEPVEEVEDVVPDPRDVQVALVVHGDDEDPLDLFKRGYERLVIVHGAVRVEPRVLLGADLSAHHAACGLDQAARRDGRVYAEAYRVGEVPSFLVVAVRLFVSSARVQV